MSLVLFRSSSGMALWQYVMWSSKMSRNSQILFLRYSQTNPMVSFASYCLFNPSTVCIFGTNCSISVGFSPNWSLNDTPVENAKNQKSYFSTSDSFCLIASHIIFFLSIIQLLQIRWLQASSSCNGPGPYYWRPNLTRHVIQISQKVVNLLLLGCETL